MTEQLSIDRRTDITAEATDQPVTPQGIECALNQAIDAIHDARSQGRDFEGEIRALAETFSALPSQITGIGVEVQLPRVENPSSNAEIELRRLEALLDGKQVFDTQDGIRCTFVGTSPKVPSELQGLSDTRFGHTIVLSVLKTVLPAEKTGRSMRPLTIRSMVAFDLRIPIRYVTGLKLYTNPL